jgi:hypothetical protein
LVGRAPDGARCSFDPYSWIIAERDQDHRDLTFEKSGLPPTRPSGCITGRNLIRLVFVLMLATDLYLMLWKSLATPAIKPEHRRSG